MPEPDKSIPPDLARQMLALKRLVMGFSILLIVMAVVLIALVIGRLV